MKLLPRTPISNYMHHLYSKPHPGSIPDNSKPTPIMARKFNINSRASPSHSPKQTPTNPILDNHSSPRSLRHGLHPFRVSPQEFISKHNPPQENRNKNKNKSLTQAAATPAPPSKPPSATPKSTAKPTAARSAGATRACGGMACWNRPRSRGL